METPDLSNDSHQLSPIKSSSSKTMLFNNRISCITKEDLAKQICISVSYINKLMSEGEIPYEKFGRSVRFRILDIEIWLQKRSRP